MDGQQFDAMARSFGPGMSRRTVLRGLAAGAVAGLLSEHLGALATDVAPSGNGTARPTNLSFLSEWGAKGKKPFKSPSFAMNNGKYLYVTDTDHGRVMRMTKSGKQLRAWVTITGRPTGIVFNSKTKSIYVADHQSNHVVKFDLNGHQQHVFSGPFSNPQGLSVDSVTGKVYVADTGNSAIKVISPSDDVTDFDVTGDGQGLNHPYDVAFLAARNGSRLYVADTGNNRICYYKLNGEFVGETSSDGFGDIDGALGHPSGLSFDAHGTLWVSDTDHARMIAMDLGGVWLNVVADAHLHQPQGIATDGHDNLWVVNPSSNTVARFQIVR